jgi:hypothetical protein
MADLPYQVTTQVAQLLNERDNAKAYGQAERVKAIEEQLAELGYKD